MADVHERYKQLKTKHLSSINSLGDSLLELSDNELRERGRQLQERVYQLVKGRYDSLPDQNADLLDQSSDLMMEVLPEAFSLAREASRRLLGMRHYDEQVVGGIALHLGNIVEMKNGEGKTIVALLPAYLNALFARAEHRLKSGMVNGFTKRGVHIMTTNSYLARRDYVWLRPVYEFLGIKVGYLQQFHGESSYSMGTLERKMMYAADVLYSPAQELIFDYLRDNNTDKLNHQVQVDRYFAIIDEVDHALLDEARTPHILSGESPGIANEELVLVYVVNSLVGQMCRDEFLISVGNDGRLHLSWSAEQVLRSLIQHLLRHTEEMAKAAWAPDRIHLVGLVFQFLEIVGYQSRQVEAALLRGISEVSQWSKSACGFYEVDSNSRLRGLSKEGKLLIKKHLSTALLDAEEMDADDLDVLIRMFRFVLENASQIFAELPTLLDVSSDTLAQLRSPKLIARIVRDLGRGIIDGSEDTILTLLVESIEEYITILGNARFGSGQELHRFVQNMIVFMNSLLPGWNRGSVPQQIWRHLALIQTIALKGEYSQLAYSAIAPEALTRAVDRVLLPILSDMIDLEKQVDRKSPLTVALALACRFLVRTSQLQKPKSSFARKSLRLYEELRQSDINRLFQYSEAKSEVSLTQWGQYLVRGYAEQAIDIGLWSGDTRDGNFASKADELLPKLRFLTNQCLRANLLHKKNNEYVIQPAHYSRYDSFTGRQIDQDVVIVGRLTGRIMPGRRWSQWLHSFLEAKEGLPVKRENETLAQISTQSYVTLYPKIAGMTGSAHIGTVWSVTRAMMKARKAASSIISALTSREKPEFIEESLFASDPVEAEFESVYGVPVVVVPEHRPCIREDLEDCIYFTQKAKLRAAVDRAFEIHDSGQPILVETISIEQSVLMARFLEAQAKQRKQNISIQLLNALTHEQEAEIITKAGLHGAITVSTQLTGRGTDIVLSKEALELGGLFVLGVERQESRRWDDQIKGRSGRQGEPGASEFHCSFEDELLRKFPNQKLMDFYRSLDFADDMPPIKHGLVTNAFSNAQVQFEHVAREWRTYTASFDRILGEYREILYSLRQRTLDDSHICPLCKQPDRRVPIKSEDWCCSDCQDADCSDSIPRWRVHFEGMIIECVDACLGNAKLERWLTEKYASDVAGPESWKWDELVGELNEWLAEPVDRKQLAVGIDFDTRLFPLAERQKLVANIQKALIDDMARSLFKQAQESILKTFRKRDRDPRNWDATELAQRLNSELFLSIRPTDLSFNPAFRAARNAKESLSAIESVVQQAIDYKLAGYDWVHPEESRILQVLGYFNPLLGKEIGREEVMTSLENGSIKSLILDHLTWSYNALVRQFGKTLVFKYENEALRSEIDKQMRTMLVETELMREELTGRTRQERIVEYGARVAQLFQRTYEDIARETVRTVLLCRDELETQRTSEGLKEKDNLRIWGDTACICGSEAPFCRCCGSLLYRDLYATLQ